MSKDEELLEARLRLDILKMADGNVERAADYGRYVFNLPVGSEEGGRYAPSFPTDEAGD